MRFTFVIVVVLGWGTAPAFAQGSGGVLKQVAYARVDLAHTIASDTDIRKAVTAKNAIPGTPQASEGKDREWSTTPALRKATTTGPCADRLRAMAGRDPVVVEAILMDERGATV